ncbi:hypothetical protein ACRAWF_35285 [Streptomyces sp. L7]
MHAANEGRSATDPDLTAFKKAGGKLILWHGLAPTEHSRLWERWLH